MSMMGKFMLIIERKTQLTCSVLTSDDIEWVREMAEKSREEEYGSFDNPAVTRIRIIEVARVIDDWKPTKRG